ncbi:unnamed protein product [Heligmosomoides polygyrus]|uniref:Phlebovirus_G2 domain-containing protein n=1 Tax=Heligmosomoides polygyrus TaxID=6339 RepID=A0A183GT41_HELPZ|nr:unnamed protein product [Heligmosomoides polygyrus]
MMEELNKTQSRQYYVLQLMPNVPTYLPSLRLTMTSVTLPPTPSLHSHFISDDYDIAITKKPNAAPLHCQSREAAIAMNCTLNDDCRCTAAENKVQCECPPYDIAEEFNRIELKLPVKTSSWELRRRKNMVIAKIPHLVSSDVMIDFNRTIEQLTTLEDDDVCTIANAPLEGCYSCFRGAEATVTCRSHAETVGEILCGHQAFVVSCSPKGTPSKLRFHFNTARQSQNCSIRCGKNLRYFTVEGVLKYIGDPQAPLTSLMGTSSAHNDFVWPDFAHIFNVVLGWYKTLALAAVGLLVALLVSYVCLQRLSLSCFWFLLHLVKVVLCLPIRLFICAISCWHTKTSKRREKQI